MFENESNRQVHTKVETWDYNVKIAGKNIFDKPMKNDLKAHDSIEKIATGQGDDYATGCLSGYPYF